MYVLNCMNKIDNKEEDHEKELEDIDDSDLFPSCEHLKLALNINLLAKNLWPYQQTLKKSRAAAKTKLAAEWEEYSKDRLNAKEKKDTRQNTERSSANHGVIVKNPATEASEDGITPFTVNLSNHNNPIIIQ
ncbi:hypothetical protein J437_LFUL019401 [Ladona fulva]|uniref:Uncharacterized protein n=1 Tax=Ladona fulva TaxID=123851 RepID=A0A8K0K0W5_LADFU|nr:hypothetical protein J437_LFUL019401 [Ladona fulva]